MRKSFVVVADEVRKLAGNVDDAIKNVNTNVENITREVGKVSKITDDLQKKVLETQSRFNKIIEEFESVAK